MELYQLKKERRGVEMGQSYLRLESTLGTPVGDKDCRIWRKALPRLRDCPLAQILCKSLGEWSLRQASTPKLVSTIH